MIYYKSQSQVELIRKSCLLVCETLALVARNLKPGVTGLEIDSIAENYIRSKGAVPGFKGYNDFPGTLCISVNDQVVHGIPTDYQFKESDIVSIDCGVYWNGYYGDAAYTFAFSKVADKTMKLLVVTKESLYKAIDSARSGNRIGDIGFAVQSLAEKENKFGVVRELVGHGIGENLHEKPSVPNYGSRGTGLKLKEGLVIAIEPMVNLGSRKITILKDKWTVVSLDRSPSAHFEHTIFVRNGEPDILSDHCIIEKAIKNNSFLRVIS